MKGSGDKLKRFTIVASLYTLAFLTIVNLINSDYPWVIFTVPAAIIWPLSVIKPRLFGNRLFAWGLSGAVVSYYLLLNVFFENGHPWIVYIIFAVGWYPFTLHFARNFNPFSYAAFGFIWSSVFFITVNWITTPNEIWAVYPIFAIFWWPLGVYFFGPKRVQCEH